jgi:hypothetical protein
MMEMVGRGGGRSCSVVVVVRRLLTGRSESQRIAVTPLGSAKKKRKRRSLGCIPVTGLSVLLRWAI